MLKSMDTWHAIIGTCGLHIPLRQKYPSLSQWSFTVKISNMKRQRYSSTMKSPPPFGNWRPNPLNSHQPPHPRRRVHIIDPPVVFAGVTICRRTPRINSQGNKYSSKPSSKKKKKFFYDTVVTKAVAEKSMAIISFKFKHPFSSLCVSVCIWLLLFIYFRSCAIVVDMVLG